MLKIAVGSKNPSKIKAARAAFARMNLAATIIGIDATSGVSAQPFSDQETIEGAVNRAKTVIDGFDYAIGLEGGVTELPPFGLFLCNWAAVANRAGEVGIGGGHRLQLPDDIASALRSGKELGDIIDQWAGANQIRSRQGTIGVLTGNRMTRADVFEDAILCAFSPFLR